MARSSYIYVVTHAETDDVLGAFTVKWEMEAWVRRQNYPVYVQRFRDAQPDLGWVLQPVEAAA